MKSAPSPMIFDAGITTLRRSGVVPSRRPRRAGASRPAAFTLVEILAALLMMAIVIPVTMEGMSIATRAGILGQRKAAAMRVAERVLNELIVEGDTSRASNSGTTADGDVNYAWSMRSETWPEDPMTQVTITVNFTVQGNEYSVDLTTLIPPSSSDLDAAGGSLATP